MEHPTLQIGEVAALAGVSVDAVRYYERLGLLMRAPRTAGGFRLFPSEAVERIRFIKQAQEIGLSLDEIKELLSGGGGAQECRRMRELLRAKLVDLDQRLEAMRKFRKTLARHLADCEKELARHGDEAECPVVVEITSPAHRLSARKQKEVGEGRKR
jgi:DNA-binding transcriptional MerR regulator